MGLLLDGNWFDQWYDTTNQRAVTSFAPPHNFVTG